MALQPWPTDLHEVWAKSPPKPGAPAESLPTHTREVLQRLADLRRLRPWLPAVAGRPGLWGSLFAAALLHDWGKAARGFQSMLRGERRWAHRHEVLSIVFVGWLSGLNDDDRLGTVAAIVSHHRDCHEVWRLYPLSLGNDDGLDELVEELAEDQVRSLYRWLRDVVPHWATQLGFSEPRVALDEQEAVAKVMQRGAAQVRAYLGAYRRLCRDLRNGPVVQGVVPGVLLRGTMVQADHLGSAHTARLVAPALDTARITAKSGVLEDEWYSHQRAAAITKGSAVLLAPTGSGKTEAALLWASRQSLPDCHAPPRLFYVLPYQASMNAMYDRLTNIFPDQVGLSHGRSVLALYERLMREDADPIWAASKACMARNLAGMHFQPVQVFSPYQMLKAAFQLKGYEAILADLAGGLFIFDEVHAYEPTRLAMILETVGLIQREFDGRFFVMSATLPSHVRLRIAGILQEPAIIEASAELYASFARHRLYLHSDDLGQPSILQQVGNELRAGKSVLVATNTVGTAQAIYQRLGAVTGDVPRVLLHSRLTGRDRLRKERELQTMVGLGRATRQPAVVVATQVVEVSLNLDLDVLYSEPAPIEALVQRMGRVNRARRQDLSPVHVFCKPYEKRTVYDIALVERSLDVLSRWAGGQAVDETRIQQWIDEAYAGPVAAQWEVIYERAAAEFREVFLATLRPFASDARLEGAFDQLFDGKEVLPVELHDEYEALRKDQPIQASQLLVPITIRRWQALLRNGQVASEPGAWPPVVDVPYSPEFGLAFDAPR